MGLTRRRKTTAVETPSGRERPTKTALNKKTAEEHAAEKEIAEKYLNETPVAKEIQILLGKMGFRNVDDPNLSEEDLRMDKDISQLPLVTVGQKLGYWHWLLSWSNERVGDLEVLMMEANADYAVAKAGSISALKGTTTRFASEKKALVESDPRVVAASRRQQVALGALKKGYRYLKSAESRVNALSREISRRQLAEEKTVRTQNAASLAPARSPANGRRG